MKSLSRIRRRKINNNNKSSSSSSRRRRRPQKILLLLLRRFCLGLIVSLFLGIIAFIYLQFFRSITIETSSSSSSSKYQQQNQNLQLRGGRSNNNHINDQKQHQKQQQLEKFTLHPNPNLNNHNNNNNNNVNYNVHAFYYPWYCTPKTDGVWMHWDHPLLPHWDPNIDKLYPTGQKHKPPDDIGSSYYPQLGPYSSSDPTIISQHFSWYNEAKIGVAVVSWLPHNQHDDNGPPIADRLPQLLDIALKFNIKIALHMEPYNDRTPQTFENDVQTLVKLYGNHPALYKYTKKIISSSNSNSNSSNNTNNIIIECELPFMYVYDQYRIPSNDWKHMFEKYDSNQEDQDCTTIFPAITIALIVEQRHWYDYVINGKFDGGYTYFASNTFTFGSKPKNWKRLSTTMAAITSSHQQESQSNNNNNNKLFIPSVGPGYDDTNVRPWNGINTHNRIIINRNRNRNRSGGGNGGDDGNGKEHYYKYYYDEEWSSAIDIDPSIISITSFNEWHEGTQIEPAIPHTRPTSSISTRSMQKQQQQQQKQQQQQYKDYGSDGGPMLYLDLTRRWVEKFTKKQQQKQQQQHHH